MNAAATDLWPDLAQLLRWAAALWGEPRALMAARAMDRREARELRGWVRALEAIARALLLAMALRLPEPSAKAPKAPNEPRLRPAPVRELGYDPSTEDDSERWAGVRFRLLPPASGGPAEGPCRRPFPLVPTGPLAFRLEALIRVAEAPGPRAARLARLLAARRRAGADPTLRILRSPAALGAATFPRDDVARAQVRAWLALDPGPEPPDTG
jgi:hypothetical protein